MLYIGSELSTTSDSKTDAKQEEGEKEVEPVELDRGSPTHKHRDDGNPTDTSSTEKDSINPPKIWISKSASMDHDLD